MNKAFKCSFQDIINLAFNNNFIKDEETIDLLPDIDINTPRNKKYYTDVKIFIEEVALLFENGYICDVINFVDEELYMFDLNYLAKDGIIGVYLINMYNIYKHLTVFATDQADRLYTTPKQLSDFKYVLEKHLI